MVNRQLVGVNASPLGYTVVFSGPLLLFVASEWEASWLVVGVVLLVFPLARLLFGSMADESRTELPSVTSALLNSIPVVYGFAIVVVTFRFVLAASSTFMSWPDVIGWTISLWLIFVFGTCVAHSLLHHADRRLRSAGHVLAGFLAYPILGYEHNRHHRLAGNTAAAEWPLSTESLWSFAARRYSKILPESLGIKGLALRGDSRSLTVRGMRLAVASTLVTWLFFSTCLGWTGATLYALVLLLVGFSIQLVTYMQHWGLGDDTFPDARQRQWGWEDDCRFQSWITMSLSVHLGHHRETRRPYYRLTLQPDSPRMPAGYILLMFAAFVPPLWRRVMTPALKYWQDNPNSPPSAGRSITCAAVYRDV